MKMSSLKSTLSRITRGANKHVTFAATATVWVPSTKSHHSHHLAGARFHSADYVEAAAEVYCPGRIFEKDLYYELKMEEVREQAMEEVESRLYEFKAAEAKRAEREAREYQVLEDYFVKACKKLEATEQTVAELKKNVVAAKGKITELEADKERAKQLQRAQSKASDLKLSQLQATQTKASQLKDAKLSAAKREISRLGAMLKGSESKAVPLKAINTKTVVYKALGSESKRIRICRNIIIQQPSPLSMGYFDSDFQYIEKSDEKTPTQPTPKESVLKQTLKDTIHVISEKVASVDFSGLRFSIISKSKSKSNCNNNSNSNSNSNNNFSYSNFSYSYSHRNNHDSNRKNYSSNSNNYSSNCNSNNNNRNNNTSNNNICNCNNDKSASVKPSKREQIRIRMKGWSHRLKMIGDSLK